jgi:hypothetical protein
MVLVFVVLVIVMLARDYDDCVCEAARGCL